MQFLRFWTNRHEVLRRCRIKIENILRAVACVVVHRVSVNTFYFSKKTPKNSTFYGARNKACIIIYIYKAFKSFIRRVFAEMCTSVVTCRLRSHLWINHNILLDIRLLTNRNSHRPFHWSAAYIGGAHTSYGVTVKHGPDNEKNLFCQKNSRYEIEIV